MNETTLNYNMFCAATLSNWQYSLIKVIYNGNKQGYSVSPLYLSTSEEEVGTALQTCLSGVFFVCICDGYFWKYNVNNVCLNNLRYLNVLYVYDSERKT